jgi:hypothetical protein
MPDREGLVITGHAYEATCIACSKPKECLLIESSDGTFDGAICYGDLKKFVRLRLANRPHTDRSTPLFDGNGTPTTDLKASRS